MLENEQGTFPEHFRYYHSPPNHPLTVHAWPSLAAPVQTCAHCRGKVVSLNKNLVHIGTRRLCVRPVLSTSRKATHCLKWCGSLAHGRCCCIICCSLASYLNKPFSTSSTLFSNCHLFCAALASAAEEDAMAKQTAS